MMKLVLKLLGWCFFGYKNISIYQRNCLVNQTLIQKAIDDTGKKRTWCEDRDLNIFVEAEDFRGIYGTIQKLEVTRFQGLFRRRNSANIRVSASHLSYDVMVKAIKELSRDDKASN
jgi:hypothetical protein